MVQFAVESWTWFTLAVGMIIVRIISRTLLFRSPKRLQYDDWIMGLLVTACYTVLIVVLNLESNTKSNLLPPSFDFSSLTPQDLADREYGSKIAIVVEQLQIIVIWACKSCLLILYYRLTHMVAIKENIAVRILAVYITLGFIVMEILYFSVWCRPFSQYWAVPTQSLQCNTLVDHRIINAVFNISSDLIMLCIALPMFIRSGLPLKRKLVLCCVFSLGIFAIITAVLNKYYSFTRPYESTWINWYIRESSTAILVANLPFTWTLLRKMFNLGSFDEERPAQPTFHSSRTAGGRRLVRVQTNPLHGGGSAGSQSGNYNPNHPGESMNSGRSMSLISSIYAAKQDHRHHQHNHQPVSDNSQHSENGLLEAALVQPRDFGASFHTMHPIAGNDTCSSPTSHSDMAMDIEPCSSPTSPSSPPPPPPRRALQFQTPSYQYYHRTPSINSAIRPHLPMTSSSYPTLPRRARLATGGGPMDYFSRTTTSSVASASTNNTATTTTTTTTTNMSLSARMLRSGTAIGPPIGAGGGRSARDRKIRARLSA